MTDASAVAPRTLSLVRVEAAYGPLYLVVVIDHEELGKHTAEEAAKFDIETGVPPEETFRHVIAVIHQDLMADPTIFSVVQTKVVERDFDFDELSRSRGPEKWQRFFKGDWAHPDTLGA